MIEDIIHFNEYSKEGNKTKYYGLRRKRFNEDLIYTYDKQRAQILCKIPGKQKKFRSDNYKLVYGDNSFEKYMAENHSNEIPKDGEVEQEKSWQVT